MKINKKWQGCLKQLLLLLFCTFFLLAKEELAATDAEVRNCYQSVLWPGGLLHQPINDVSAELSFCLERNTLKISGHVIGIDERAEIVLSRAYSGQQPSHLSGIPLKCEASDTEKEQNTFTKNCVLETGSHSIQLNNTALFLLDERALQVSILTESNPRGVVAGQIVPQTRDNRPFTGNLLQATLAANAADNNLKGYGAVIFEVSDIDEIMTFSGYFNGLSSPVIVNEHTFPAAFSGVPGQLGELLFPLDVELGADYRSGIIRVNKNKLEQIYGRELVAKLYHSGVVIRIPTEQYPDGELMGSVVRFYPNIRHLYRAVNPPNTQIASNLNVLIEQHENQMRVTGSLAPEYFRSGADAWLIDFGKDDGPDRLHQLYPQRIAANTRSVVFLYTPLQLQQNVFTPSEELSEAVKKGTLAIMYGTEIYPLEPIRFQKADSRVRAGN
ncbi:MAG: CHRD domain-containing protein [Balneolales bacterium]|nr:CHRD domain-containing protein [Balneolales bacterium]